MASWQAHLIVPFLKWTVKRKLSAATDLAAARKLFEVAEPAVSSTVAAMAERVGGVPGEWSRPRSAPSLGTMLYLHGGGYIGCSAQTHRPITNTFANAGFAVFAPDYRLAPEHPFPAAVDDAFAVYRGLLERALQRTRSCSAATRRAAVSPLP